MLVRHQFCRTDADENNLILTLIINKMKKVLVVNITSSALTSKVNSANYATEFELTELNQHLADGWEIYKSDIVTNQSNSTFSVIYQLVK